MNSLIIPSFNIYENIGNNGKNGNYGDSIFPNIPIFPIILKGNEGGELWARDKRPKALSIARGISLERLTPSPLFLPVEIRACRLFRRVLKYDKTLSNYK